ncbi:E3 ubiquitin-protein ligase MYCBP2 isoform X2 [Adelges cooleyi]|uniref:E3 ubiquitin-protein ligase MYCBP2 isoform X2 n=1 Tax=Adelges cooleyi TaxID=133065 RepID=UPI00217F8473|nr:E3 ubiquitin-protein ligase MYCBP2 isoform X2 [Adelges cooleyi]
MLPEVDGIEQLYKRFFQEAQEIPKKLLPKKNVQKTQKGAKLYKDGGWTMYVSGNASSFAVLSAARYAVFDRYAKKADEAYWISSSAPIYLNRTLQSTANIQPVSSAEIFIPKVVGIGLRSVFELIKESRKTAPDISTKALTALLDIIQYQTPEALKDEPSEVIDPLYELLLDMATGRSDNSTYGIKAVACSCLISLVIVRGDTGKILNTLATLLMCTHDSSPRKIILPKVLINLQKFVRVLTHGDYEAPDWMNFGIPKSSEIVTLNLNYLNNIKGVASDGNYLYTYSDYGLHKIGTGFGGTISGLTYLKMPRTANQPLHSTDVSLGFYQKVLYLRMCNINNPNILEIEFLNKETLKKIGRVQVDEFQSEDCEIFSDGDYLCFLVQSANNYAVKCVDPSTGKLAKEVPLMLSRRNVRIYGVTDLWDSITAESAINSATDEEVSSIASLKDSFIISVKSGRAMQWSRPKGQSVMNSHRSVWSELTLPNQCKIIKVASGHDGSHCVFLSDLGSAYFLGVAKRGEDGEEDRCVKPSKVTKPKKITKMDGHYIVDVACNHGTTALVTKDGLLYMFGKDTIYCDRYTGLVNDLKNAKIVQVALGKAHAIALSVKGHVYSFGINNKGQCGRDTGNVQANKNNYPSMTSLESADEMNLKNDRSFFEDDCFDEVPNENICKPGTHLWRNGPCMICTVCRECTGYGVGCFSSIQSNRKPGQKCGCGDGDAGCTVCGCCRICAQQTKEKSEFAILGSNGIGDIADGTIMMRIGIMGGASNAVSNHSSDIERDSNARLSSLPPARIFLPTDCPVVQISCGLHHTVLLHSDGKVVTFGSNTNGQLGCSLSHSRRVPTEVKIPRLKCPITCVSAGSNHTALVSKDGKLYTFGSYLKNQLGRICESNNVPLCVEDIYPPHTRRANVVMCCGDQTIVKVDEGLINSKILSIAANKETILVMTSNKCLAINKQDGTCNSHSGKNQVQFNEKYNGIWCFDILYNNLWHVNEVNEKAVVTCYNVNNATRKPDSNSLLSYELALPPTAGISFSRVQILVNLLTCMDILGQNSCMFSLRISPSQNNLSSINSISESKKEFLRVNRFASLGGGWGYSGHSVEAIRFSVDCNVLLIGFGLFGGRGEYTARLKLYDIGMDENDLDDDEDGDLVTVTEELTFECAPRQRYPVIFEEPVILYANRWYEVSAKINGPSSDCGSSGMCSVTSDEQVTFTFKSSRRSNNGTDINAGQIPEILYRTAIPDSISLSTIHTSNSDTQMLSEAFSRNVNKECFKSLIMLLRWAWSSIMDIAENMCMPFTQQKFYTDMTLTDTSTTAVCQLKLLMYISQSCFHLLQSYIYEVYPDQVDKIKLAETEGLAKSVIEVRQVLQHILSDPRAKDLLSYDRIFVQNKGNEVVTVMKCMKWLNQILDECHRTFVSCYHAFYPTPHLKLHSLWDRAQKKLHATHRNKLLTAVVAALCTTPFRLRELMPILTSTDSQSKPSSFDTDSPYYFPMLTTAAINVAKQHSRNESKQPSRYEPGWDELLGQLLDMIATPVRKALWTGKKPDKEDTKLATNCSHLVARIVAELSSQATITEDGVEVVNEGDVMLTTPSRFSKINQTKTWNAGNGSPDAICFWVDRPGISIAGCGIFGGVGNYEYELELLAEKSQSEYEEPHGNRWKSLIVTRGSFGPNDSAINYVVDVNFDYPIRIKERVKYAIRLRNYGGRTNNGDMGLSCVKGQDNTIFSFNTCSLSLNGTTQSRGQIPYILYYSNGSDKNNDSEKKMCNKINARESTLGALSAIVDQLLELLNIGAVKIKHDPLVYKYLGESAIVNILMPLVLSHVGPLITFSKDAKSATHVLDLIRKLMPEVTLINMYAAENLDLYHRDICDKLDNCAKPATKSKLQKSEQIKGMIDSHHYAWVESDHPYKTASVSNYKVKFPKEVKWLCLEFDPRSCTAQAEDCLQLYIPNYRDYVDDDADKQLGSSPYIPVLKKFSNDPVEWPFAAVMLPGNEVVFSMETSSDYTKNERATRYGFRCLVIGYEVDEMSKYQKMGYGLIHLETELSFLGGMCVSTMLKCDLILPDNEQRPPTHHTTTELESLAAAHRAYSRHSGLLKKGFAFAPITDIQQVMDGKFPLRVDGNENRFLKEFVSCTPRSAGCRLARWLQPESAVEPDSCELTLCTAEVRCGCPAKFIVRTRDQYGNLVHSTGLKVVFIAQSTLKSKINLYADKYPIVMTSGYFGGHSVPRTHIPYETVVKDKFRYQAITFMKQYENYSFEELRVASPPLKGDSELLEMEAQGNGSYLVYWTPTVIGCYDVRVEVDGFSLTNQVKRVDVKEAPLNGVGSASQEQDSATSTPRLLQHVGKYSAGLRIRTHPSLQSEKIGLIPVMGIIGYTDEVSNDDGDWVMLNPDSVERYCRQKAPKPNCVEAWAMRVCRLVDDEMFLVKVNQEKPNGDEAAANDKHAQSTAIVRDYHQDTPTVLSTPRKFKVIRCGASGHNIRNQPTFRSHAIGMLVHGDVISTVDKLTNNEGMWVKLSDESIYDFCGSTPISAWSLANNNSNVVFLKPISEQSTSNNEESAASTRVDNDVKVFNKSTYVIENNIDTGFNEKQYSPKRKKDPKANVEGMNANAVLQIPYHRSRAECRMSNGNTVMMPPGSPRRSPRYGSSEENKHLRTPTNPDIVNARRDEEQPLSTSSESTAPASTSWSSLDTPFTPSLSTSMDSSGEPNPEHMNKFEVFPGVTTATQTTPDNEFGFKDNNKTNNRSSCRGRQIAKNNDLPTTDSLDQYEQSDLTVRESAPLKDAMSPSVAESLRAVFAAFLWHEGIVHDAMTCASFLKFYPTLPKNGAVVTKRTTDRNKDRSRQRHSVEVTTGAGGYDHIRPNDANRSKTGMAFPAEGAITEESLTSSGNSETAEAHGHHPIPSSSSSSGGGTRESTVNFLPPALSCMVRLWDEVSTAMLQMITSNVVLIPNDEDKGGDNSMLAERNHNKRIARHVTLNKEPIPCELCAGKTFPHPIAHHLSNAHPGCGGNSGGRGYTSAGAYCTGWAGACGYGGIDGTSWYLLCETCRENFLKKAKLPPGRQRKTGIRNYESNRKLKSNFGTNWSVDGLHIVFKENAMFLLDLVSSSSRQSVNDEATTDSGNWDVGDFNSLISFGNFSKKTDCDEAILLQLQDRSSAVGPTGDDAVDGTTSRSVHRSASMDIEVSPINRRKRINSTCDLDNGLSLMCVPSAALQALVAEVDAASAKETAVTDVFKRPVIEFVVEQHSLTDLKWSMKQAVRKAACRSYALQALNWLLHEVSQASCLHDLLWWFVIALSAEVRTIDGTNESPEPRCRHPLSDLYLAGEAVHPLPKVFYTFLQTVSDLMLYLPSGSALQMMAIRCWDIHFTTADHMFLHRSKVFSNISKILSHSEEYQDVCEDLVSGAHENEKGIVTCLKDITENTEITASSRSAMIANLIDQSTETFWESSDDDKSKYKTITIHCADPLEIPKAIYVYIDNSRDLSNKVSLVIFTCGPSIDKLKKIKSSEVENRFCGWIGAFIQDDSQKVICIEMRGLDTCVRLRQVKVLGSVTGESQVHGRQYSYSTVQHRLCENETLKVFRSITFQVFGKLIQGKSQSMDSSVDESKDLKEHMVGILFSQNRLTHLQKQVCTHIVEAIKKEATTVREEWEKTAGKKDSVTANGTATPTDAYCFEMLSMVLALSGSNVGRSYLANQHDLLSNLLSLLHTGSARVQRQVTLLLKRVLPEVSPGVMASLTDARLPCTELSMASHPPYRCRQVGLLDHFLAVIAKALTLQVKVKGVGGSKVVNSVKLHDVDLDVDDSRWYLRGAASRQLADDIIQILLDMANGKFCDDENWKSVSRAAIAENILRLTRLGKEQRTMEACVKTPILWLALASHCVLHPEHAERLSSGHWTKPENSVPAPPRPLCMNHDDGETGAVIQCLICGNLCVDCDRILHLNRKTKQHQRQVCKEEEEAIRVDLHEGCGRTKLFWLLALADKATLQALVEFRDASTNCTELSVPVARVSVQSTRVGICRFCGMMSNDGLLAIGNVCANDECQLHAHNACQKVLKCGHLCGGIKDEMECLPCLNGCVNEENARLKQDADDMCMICFTDALSAAPSIQLVCGHVFHYQCCKRVLINKWSGPRIAFGFQQCPICKHPIDHSCLADLLDPIRGLMADVKRKALMRLEYEGDCSIQSDQAATFAMEKYAYYVCHKCKKAYYGGEARCELDIGIGVDYDPAELVCGGCSDVACAQMCPKHGTDLLEYKCRYCCSVAVFFCFGTTHFCNACHDDFQRVTNLQPDELPPCPAGPRGTSLNVEECPLHVKHPPTGEEFALGCGVCRNAHTF